MVASQDAGREGPVDTEPVNQGRPRSKVVGGRFVIDRLIARGGMGAVYLAHQLNLQRPVALKIMTPPPDPEEGESFEDRFRLEAETLASLHHNNIVTVYDYGPTDDGRYYLALEYVEGPRFTDLIRKGRLEPERAVQLMLQVCNGLFYAHRRGVVHRDLKPSNLLIRVEDGVEQVKVVDFGLVKVIEADQSITRQGLVLGSPHCMAPEQVKGEEIDHRADIYAIGILMFRSLTGTWPFHGETVAGTMIAHVNEPQPTFYSVAPDLRVPDGLEEVVQRCMSKTPAERYADVGELITALAACVDVPKDQFLTVSSFHTRVQDARKPEGKAASVTRHLWIPLTIAVVLLIGVVAALALRPWGDPDPVATSQPFFAPGDRGAADPAVVPTVTTDPAQDAPAPDADAPPDADAAAGSGVDADRTGDPAADPASTAAEQPAASGTDRAAPDTSDKPAASPADKTTAAPASGTAAARPASESTGSASSGTTEAPPADDRPDLVETPPGDEPGPAADPAADPADTEETYLPLPEF